MKILQLVHQRQRRGAEVFATQLADAMVARGHAVDVLGIYPPTTAALTPTSAGAADLTTSTNGKLSLRRVRELAEYVAESKPDVVQANGADTLKYAALARLAVRHRFVLVYRNISVASHWLRYPGHRIWVKLLLANVDHVAAVSTSSADDFVATYSIAPSRISVIPIATPLPDTFSRSQRRMRLVATCGIDEAADILIHVGSFSPEKNHSYLLDVFSAVCARRPVHLVLVGDGPLRSAVEATALRKGLRSRVHFLGDRPDAAELMAGADLLVLPSTVEGVPAVILEAAAVETPAVAADVGGVREAVLHGSTGLVVPLESPDEFAQTILDLLADDERRRKMGYAARTFVQERYDLRMIVDAFESLYRRLMSASAN